jgi:AcrR family transcriptional regulator
MKSPARAQRLVSRSRLEVDERRAQLLVLGCKIFSENAYDEVSIDGIAAAAGISKGLLYHYFPTKRDFYIAALRETAKQLIEETLPKTDEGSVDERIRHGIATYLDFVERRGPAYVALMRGGFGADPEIAGVIEETRMAFLARIVGQMPPEMNTPLAKTAMRGWIGFVEATSVDWVANRSVPLATLVELSRTMLWEATKEVLRLKDSLETS